MLERLTKPCTIQFKSWSTLEHASATLVSEGSDMTIPATETPKVVFQNVVRFTITGVSQTQYDEIVALILATEYVVADESGPWLRRGKPPVFIATIQSPRTLEGWQRNRLQAQIIQAVPNAHVVVW